MNLAAIPMVRRIKSPFHVNRELTDPAGVFRRRAKGPRRRLQLLFLSSFGGAFLLQASARSRFLMLLLPKRDRISNLISDNHRMTRLGDW